MFRGPGGGGGGRGGRAGDDDESVVFVDLGQLESELNELFGLGSLEPPRADDGWGVPVRGHHGGGGGGGGVPPDDGVEDSPRARVLKNPRAVGPMAGTSGTAGASQAPEGPSGVQGSMGSGGDAAGHGDDGAWPPRRGRSSGVHEDPFFQGGGLLGSMFGGMFGALLEEAEREFGGAEFRGGGDRVFPADAPGQENSGSPRAAFHRTFTSTRRWRGPDGVWHSETTRTTTDGDGNETTETIRSGPGDDGGTRAGVTQQPWLQQHSQPRRLGYGRPFRLVRAVFGTPAPVR